MAPHPGGASVIRFELEQSDTEIYSAHGGLALVGQLINRYSGLKKRLQRIPLRHGIAHIDLFRVYLGLLCTGKNDFEAVDGVRQDRFFRKALGIGQMPSSARLRQRFDAQAEEYVRAADDAIVPLLSRLKAPVSAEASGHVALHADVFCLDNSKTRKEGVGRTYHGYDGYAPIGAYLGGEGWCVGAELRPGTQHSQKEFGFFLDRILPRARQDAVEEEPELLLAVLGAGTQLSADAPAFATEIGPDRGVAVVAVVGAPDALFAGLGVVQAEHVGMQRDMAARLGAHRRLEPAQQRDDRVIGRPDVLLGLRVETLAQPGRRGHLADPEGLAEKPVLTDPIDRLEVVLAGAQKAEVDAEQVDVRDAMAQRDALQALLEPAVAVDQLPDQGQPAVRGVDLRVTLFQFEADHRCTPGVRRHTRRELGILHETTTG